MASDDAGLSRVSFMIIPNTKRHTSNMKTDQLPISEVITGLPRPYHHNIRYLSIYLLGWARKNLQLDPPKVGDRQPTADELTYVYVVAPLYHSLLLLLLLQSPSLRSGSSVIVIWRALYQAWEGDGSLPSPVFGFM